MEHREFKIRQLCNELREESPNTFALFINGSKTAWKAWPLRRSAERRAETMRKRGLSVEVVEGIWPQNIIERNY